MYSSLMMVSISLKYYFLQLNFVMCYLNIRSPKENTSFISDILDVHNNLDL